MFAQQNDAFRECLEQQALKHNGKVELNSGRPSVRVPTELGGIELSLLILEDDNWREHGYARFRMAQFAKQHFVVRLKSKSLLFKPLVIGDRIQLPDEQFHECFILAGNDPAFVGKLLTHEIRDKLRTESLQVSFGRRTDAALLDWEKGWLSVHTQFLRTSDEVFNALIETAKLFQERFAMLSGPSDLAV